MSVVESPAIDSFPATAIVTTNMVTLANGKSQSLDGLSVAQLQQLQWEQEQQFAVAIKNSAKGSVERTSIIAQAYDTVCQILAAQQEEGQPLVMGLDPRYVKLVISKLENQVRQGFGQPRLFEVGFGCGMMLKEAADLGFLVSGLEVSTAMRDEALQLLGDRFENQLFLGDIYQVTKDSLTPRPSLIYWNDVFEHVCPDEIDQYLSHLHSLLVPGGSLITITPNWLLRPSDVTGDFCPPRTEARGLHLKEYRLAEVTRLLKQAGFRHVATPLVVTKGHMLTFAGGLRLPKQLFEPLLDKLPLRATNLLCRGFGMSCTIAMK